MKWLIGIALVVAVIGVAVRMIGGSLPVQHRTIVTRTIMAPADDVWSLISDLSQWQDWRTDVKQVEILPGNAVRVTDSNGTVRYRIEKPAERTLITIIEQEGLPWGGRWIWRVERQTDHTSLVTIIEEGEIYSPMFRFFARFVFGFEGTMKSVLDQLEAAAGRRSGT